MFSIRNYKFKFTSFNIAIMAVVIMVLSYMIGIPFFNIMELKTLDLRFRSRGKIATTSKVALAVIDEKSVAKEGKWIWPRSKIADLINKLSDAGAKVIAFDIGFLEADEKSTVRTIQEIQNKISSFDKKNPALTRYLEDLKIKTDNDRLLASAIINSRAKIVLGYFFQADIASAGHVEEKELKEHLDNVQGSEYKSISYSSETAKHASLFEGVHPQSNIKTISETTPYSGYFNMFPDEDGVVRWLPAVLKCRESLYAPLSIASAAAYLDKQLSVKIQEYGIDEIGIGELSIPVDEIGRIIVNYRGPAKSFPHIPVTDILKKTADTSLIKDTIVIVGATAVGIYDLRVTPFSNVFPGLEIHANVIDSILSKDFIYYPSWTYLFDIMSIIIAGLLLGFVIPRVSIAAGTALFIVQFLGYIFICYMLFFTEGWILNLVYPLTGMLIVYISITLYRYMAESKQKKFIRDAFSTYLAPSVVEQLINSPEKLDLGGQERNITAFFSDVQGFTSIAEKLSPKEIVDLLNEFLTEMTDIILEYEGTLDKFEGDAIIAFFGAPNDLPNHAEVACRACIKMQKKLEALRESWRLENRPVLKMRIGLCSGNAIVGNMGSTNRMDYTMMGDTVNIAARLEGVNKIYGVYTMISDSTFAAAGNGIVTRELDMVNVVGRTKPVNIYELIGYAEDVDDRMRTTFELYQKGLEAYRKMDWDTAISHFISALDISINDGPSKTMLARCNEYKISPPGKDWNGAYTLTMK
ncbi:MAG: CHASE2 domain-containing protein [Desulfobacteraceae bacterium]|nr:MAG: CHASE2 domain-containing protein [Desulfobacteraceae bacterium]